MNKALLIIDAQNDFCDPNGRLFVPGADEDCKRLAEYIEKHLDAYDSIVATLDSHHVFDIGHPAFWVDEDGKNPDPFTMIKAEEVHDGKWKPSLEEHKVWVNHYMSQVKTSMVWPVHCLIGSAGQAIQKDVNDALEKWQAKKLRGVRWVTKGANPFTENYSAVKSAVEFPQDPSTKPNVNFLNYLNGFDEVHVAGEALDYCVACTVRDVIEVVDPKKVILFSDLTSAVNAPGADHLGQEFLDEMKEKGMRITNACEVATAS